MSINLLSIGMSMNYTCAWQGREDTGRLDRSALVLCSHNLRALGGGSKSCMTHAFKAQPTYCEQIVSRLNRALLNYGLID